MRSCGICRDVRYVRNVVYRRVIVYVRVALHFVESWHTGVALYGSVVIHIWESMEKCWIWESYDIGKIKI